MTWLSILLLAIAVSFDSLAIGVTYGISQIKIPPVPRILLSFVSAIFFFLAISIGNLLTSLLKPLVIEYIGGIILVLLGIYSIWRASQIKQTESTTIIKPTIEDKIFNLRIPSLGLIITIIKEPIAADYDFSNIISNKEAILLGLALSLDAFGAGLSAAILKIPALSTALAVMLANYLFISQGLKGGEKMQEKLDFPSLQWIPGLIIISLGIVKLLT